MGDQREHLRSCLGAADLPSTELDKSPIGKNGALLASVHCHLEMIHMNAGAEVVWTRPPINHLNQTDGRDVICAGRPDAKYWGEGGGWGGVWILIC